MRRRWVDWYYVKVLSRAFRDTVRSAATRQGIVIGNLFGVAVVGASYLLADVRVDASSAVKAPVLVVGTWVVGVFLLSFVLAPVRMYREEIDENVVLRAAVDDLARDLARGSDSAVDLFKRGHALQRARVKSRREWEEWESDVERWRADARTQLSPAQSALVLNIIGLSTPKLIFQRGFNVEHRADRGVLHHQLSNLLKVIERRESKSADGRATPLT